jgi:hypothetical protein
LVGCGLVDDLRAHRRSNYNQASLILAIGPKFGSSTSRVENTQNIDIEYFRKVVRRKFKGWFDYRHAGVLRGTCKKLVSVIFPR